MVSLKRIGVAQSRLYFKYCFDIATVAIPVEIDEKLEAGVDAALLGNDVILSPERYPTSQFHQFWTVLKRTLLFSRRDWVLLNII